MKKIGSKIVVGVLAAAVIGGGIYAWTAGQEAEPASLDLNAPVTVLAKTDMVKSISASGAVESANSVNIYPSFSVQNYPIMEILAETGDAVKKGDVLAKLDMSKLQEEIAQAELNLLSAQTAADEEIRLNGDAVVKAETALQSSQISLDRQQLATANAVEDLREAQTDMEEPFDSRDLDKIIEDALLSVERAQDTLSTAREDLAEEQEREFNDFTYQTALRDAEINLERRQDDLLTAQEDLDEETAKTFDAYDTQNTINDARKAYDRARTAYDDAETALEEAEEYYDYVYDESESEAEVRNAKLAFDNAQQAFDSAKQAREDARIAHERAIERQTKAEKDFEDDVKDPQVTVLEDSVKNAANLLEDAQRAFDDATETLADAAEDWETNQKDVIKAAGDTLTRAENSLVDAQRAYEKALQDKEQAIEDYMEANEDLLKKAQRASTDASELLDSMEVSLTQAQDTLEQAQSTPNTAGTTVEIQRINLDKLYTTLDEGEIIAAADGVITENNAKVGALPTGILFVIEDTENLYVSANIKEYSLASVSVGQDAVVTTDATGDKTYTAKVDYISPKAVSAAGSTSVEFEIHAAFDTSEDDAVRIGMNAFIDVITDTREGVYSVPLSAIVTDERGTFVYSPNGTERTEIPVTVGIKTTTMGEISGDGLRDGMEILTQPVEMPTSNMPGMMMMG